MLEQVWHCDRCKQPIGNDARYYLKLSFMFQDGGTLSPSLSEGMEPTADLCGRCASTIREVLKWPGDVLLDPKETSV